jgi:hypothetical protein
MKPILMGLVALALVAAAGCDAMQSTHVKGATVHSDRASETTTGEIESAHRHFEFPPLPVFAPPAMPVQAAPIIVLPPSAMLPQAATSQRHIELPPEEQAPNMTMAGNGPPLPPPAPAAPTGYVSGGVLDEHYYYKGKDHASTAANADSRGADIAGPGNMTNKGGEAPAVNLETGEASGGTYAFASKIAQTLKGPLILVWIGAAALLVGLLLAFLLKMYWTGASVGAAGIVLILCGLAAEAYPWISVVGLGVIVLGGVAFLVYAWKTGTLQTAFTQVVQSASALKTKLFADPTVPNAAVVAHSDAAVQSTQDTATQALAAAVPPATTPPTVTP